MRDVDGVVEELNATFLTGGLDPALAMGELLLETCYQGDLAVWEAEGTRAETLKVVKEHPRLRVSFPHLSNCLALVAQMPVLGERRGRALSFSHHRTLFRVKDKGLKRRLADQAVRGAWGYRELQAEVARVLPPARGRRSDTPLARLVKAVGKAVRAAEGEQAAMLADPERETLRRTLRTLTGRLSELVLDLEGH